MKPSRLFITGGKEISLNDGTTHGDPIATAMYALGLMLLISSIISNNTGNLIHVAFADDLKRFKYDGKICCIMAPTLVIT